MPRSLEGLNQELPLTLYFSKAKKENKSLVRSGKKRRHRSRTPDHAEPSQDDHAQSSLLKGIPDSARNTSGKRRRQARSTANHKKSTCEIHGSNTTTHMDSDIIDLTQESQHFKRELISLDAEETLLAPLAPAHEDSGAGHSLATPPPTECRSFRTNVREHHADKPTCGSIKGKSRAALPTPQTTVRRPRMKKAPASAMISSEVDAPCATTASIDMNRASDERPSMSTAMPGRTSSAAPSVVHELVKDPDNPFVVPTSPVTSQSSGPIRAVDPEPPARPSDSMLLLIPSSQSQYFLNILATPSKRKARVDLSTVADTVTMSWAPTSQSLEEDELASQVSPRAFRLVSPARGEVTQTPKSKGRSMSATPHRSSTKWEQHHGRMQGDCTPERSTIKSALSSPAKHPGDRHHTSSPSRRLTQDDDAQGTTGELQGIDDPQTETESESDTEFMGFVCGLGEDYRRRNRRFKESNRQTQLSKASDPEEGTDSLEHQGTAPVLSESLVTQSETLPSLVKGFLGIFE